MMLTLVFALLVPSVSHATEGPTGVDLWADTTLGFSDLQTLMPVSDCVRNAPVFSACMTAVNTMAGLAQEGAAVVPTRLIGTPGYPVTRVIRAFGSFSWVILVAPSEPTPGTSFIEIFSENQRARLRQLDAYEAAFNEAGRAAFPFERALEEMSESFIVTDEESSIIAGTLNAFIRLRFAPHDSLQPEARFLEMSQPVHNFAGVGVTFAITGNDVVILNTMEGSPAFQAGLRINDVIVEIDGLSTRGLNEEQVQSRIQGDPGTTLSLRVRRRRRLMPPMLIQRANIAVRNVRGRVIENHRKKIGVLRVESFLPEGTCDQTRQELNRLKAQGIEALVLDLRSNGGGLIQEAACMVGLFVGPNQTVVTSQLSLPYGPHASSQASRTTQTQTLTTEAVAQVSSLSMITLINGGSASASEIVSGALQDLGRSWLAGQRSFGKGTILRVMPDVPRNGILNIQTIGEFLLPSGRSNNVIGLAPDFVVPPVPNPTAEDLFALREADMPRTAAEARRVAAIVPSSPRRTEADRISQRCRGHDRRAQTLYNGERRRGTQIAPDYMLYDAIELLQCTMVN